MALQFSTTLRNNLLDSIETTIGTSPTLEIRSGSPPSDCASTDTGTLLCSISLPSDWMNTASNGSKTLNGTWSGTAGAAGTAGHFRIKQGTTCHMQGTITATGGGGDMTLDNVNINSGQTVTITTFTLTAPGA